MKKTILFLLTVLSLNSFACPDLSGQYFCKELTDQGEESHFSLDIFQDDRTLNISLNGEASEQMIADGLERPYDSGIQSWLTLSCHDEVLNLTMRANLDLGDEFFNMLSNTKIFLRGRKLFQKTTTLVNGKISRATTVCTQF